MYGRKEVFAKMDKQQMGNITFGNLSQNPIKGKCDVTF